MNWLHDLHDEMAAHGLTPTDELITDGEIHRFEIAGEKRGRKSGWYVVHADSRPTAVFGSWKTGEKHTWCANRERVLSAAGPSRDEIHRNRIRRNAEREASHQATAERAADMWARAGAPSRSHPYLRTKGIGVYDIRQLGPMLLVPMLDADGLLRNLQTIRGDGQKRFLRGGRVSGLSHMVGQRTNRIWLCEGYATAVSLHIDTAECVVCAFSAGNLLAAAQAAKYQWRPTEVAVMADDDWRTEGNPGITAATTVSEQIRCSWFRPDFPDDRPAWATDYNDAARLWAERRASA